LSATGGRRSLELSRLTNQTIILIEDIDLYRMVWTLEQSRYLFG
jgi:hypothetical protein